VDKGEGAEKTYNFQQVSAAKKKELVVGVSEDEKKRKLTGSGHEAAGGRLDSEARMSHAS